TEGSRRTSSSKQMWEWTASRMQTFAPESPDTLSYVHRDDRWALLVAASKGWGNYRFQADVFAMYHILRRHGYDEDHIMLICEDDIAGNQSNKHKGEIRVSDAGENLYNAAAVDYRLSSVSPSDIAAIMQGKVSERLPHVLMPDSNDNVFVFWSGHGYVDSLDFGGNRAVAYSEMHNILRSIPHRKMLVATEACYSGGLGEYCEGKLDGVLFITAANPYETSHADVWSKDLGVYMSNGFTRGFQEAIDNNPEVSIRDLYYTLARNTSGSHVRLYNISKYGNVYSDSMAEYLK
ncbi:MAG: legumain, partial [Bacteroidaceae bacterium]|nr:legumain [Bacteroidaceae bacterium]